MRAANSSVRTVTIARRSRCNNMVLPRSVRPRAADKGRGGGIIMQQRQRDTTKQESCCRVPALPPLDWLLLLAAAGRSAAEQKVDHQQQLRLAEPLRGEAEDEHAAAATAAIFLLQQTTEWSHISNIKSNVLPHAGLFSAHHARRAALSQHCSRHPPFLG